jgi:predicted transcriptional regulator
MRNPDSDSSEPVDPEDLSYRLYLMEKLRSAEEDVRMGRVLTHEEVVEETARWFAEER